MPQKEQPQFHPIAMLPTLTPHIDGMLEAAQDQYQALQPARARPHVLDDFTVSEVVRVFTTQKNDLPLFDEQLARWKSGKLTSAQEKEVDRLVTQMKSLHAVVDQILALADELAKGTIEKVMAKSDEQLGLEYLMKIFGEEKR